MNAKRILPILIVVFAGLLFYLNLGPGKPDGFVDLTAVDAAAQLKQTPEARIVDIRTPAEFKEGHIKDAKLIDYYAQDYKEKWSRLDRNGLYFVYCRTGNRSAQTMRMLKDLGFKRIWHLKNGIMGWKRAGLPLER